MDIIAAEFSELHEQFALLLIEAAGHWDSPDALIVSCLERLRAILLGHGGLPARIVATIAVAFAVGSLIAKQI